MFIICRLLLNALMTMLVMLQKSHMNIKCISSYFFYINYNIRSIFLLIEKTLFFQKLYFFIATKDILWDCYSFVLNIKKCYNLRYLF